MIVKVFPSYSTAVIFWAQFEEIRRIQFADITTVPLIHSLYLSRCVFFFFCLCGCFCLFVLVSHFIISQLLSLPYCSPQKVTRSQGNLVILSNKVPSLLFWFNPPLGLSACLSHLVIAVVSEVPHAICCYPVSLLFYGTLGKGPSPSVVLKCWLTCTRTEEARYCDDCVMG